MTDNELTPFSRPRQGATFEIDGVPIGDSTDCYVIAEIGQNHQGSVEQAIKMFEAAADCGANAVKIQKRDNATLYTAEYYNRPYEHENSFGHTYGAHREALEFDRPQYKELKACADELGLTFFATAWDYTSADFLADLDMPAYKIASGDLTSTPLLRYVADIGKPIVFSTGCGTLDDVRRAYDTVAEVNSQVAILQCTSGYPADWSELDLHVIRAYRELFPDAVIGFSSHDNGISMSVAAYVLGARIVEKHFTLNRTLKGTDHPFSLEPQGLSKMIRDLKRTRLALGDGTKNMYASENEAALKMRKKLVAARDLPAGHTLTVEDIALKSPGDGVPPYELDRFVGRMLRHPVTEDAALTFEVLEELLPDQQFVEALLPAHAERGSPSDT